MTAQHRMTKAYPLACNCKPGWVSTFFLPTRTHPLACNCETGWVFFLPFFQVTERRRRRRAMSARCRRLSPSAPTTTSTTHPLACNCETGWVFIIFFFKSTNDDDEPCRLVVIVCLRLHPRQR